MRKAFIATFLFLALSVIASAQDITFTWDPHEQAAEITGFRLFQSKQSNTYDLSAPVAIIPGGTTTTYTLVNPDKPGRAYFVITAYVDDPENPEIPIQSGPSNEVTTVIKPHSPKGLLTSPEVIAKTVIKIEWARIDVP